MKICQNYIDELVQSETVFDMAAICYSILERNIRNPIKFISDYVDESSSSKAINPNLQLLHKFSDRVGRIVEQYSESKFQWQKNSIIDLLRNIELEKFQNEKENQLSAIYTLLSTIDSMVPFWDGPRIAGSASLNREESPSTHLVYIASKKLLHEDLLKEIGRERKGSADFGEGFSNLLFLQKDKLPGGAKAPEICFLPHKRQDKQYRLKIAIIPGVTGMHFKESNTVGTTYIIEYINEEKEQEKVGKELWNKIEAAIWQGAEFILLPEFSVSEEILEYIRKKLNEWRKIYKKRSGLIAVFPGSTWITSEDNEHNNEQIILSAMGEEIGRYYKNTPFRKKRKKDTGYIMSEGLDNPGYRTSIFLVEGIGYVLPATCRDVIDGEYTDYLVRKFYPTLLLIPAWSSSGRSFEHPMKTFAKECFTNSVLCNGCGALEGSASLIGGAAIVSKQGTVAQGEFMGVEKPTDCGKRCGKQCENYCGYLIEIDFDPAKLTQPDWFVCEEL